MLKQCILRDWDGDSIGHQQRPKCLLVAETLELEGEIQGLL